MSKRGMEKTVAKFEDLPYDPNEQIDPEELRKLIRRIETEDDGSWRTRFRLTLKQKLWAEAYVGRARGNATGAARLAGFSDDNAVYLRIVGNRMLTNANVGRYVAYLLAKRRGGPKETLAGIAELATITADAFLGWDDKGRPFLDLAKARNLASLGAIKELKQESFEGANGAPVVTKMTVKLYDRLAALQTLAKVHGQLVDPAENHKPDSDESKLLRSAMSNPKLFRKLTDLYEELDVLNAADAEHKANGNGGGRN